MRNVQFWSRIACRGKDSLFLNVKSSPVLPPPWTRFRFNSFSTDVTKLTDDLRRYYNMIGQREVVGFGINGRPDYVDSTMFPYPAIRFREITPDFKALKEKEKGSWKMLTINEKKCLYRISFCQTLAEVDAPTGDWKKITGTVLLILSCALWFHLLIVFFVRTDRPESLKPESQLAQLQRMLDLKMNPIEGISSMWDYENNNWKGRPPRKDHKKKKTDKVE